MEPTHGLKPAASREALEARGFMGPLSVFSAKEAAAVADRLRRAPPAEWKKGHAASSADYFAVATHPAILGAVSSILGEDVMLWGASLVVRKPGRVHPWHTDMETADGIGRTVTVWLGLEHVNRNSSLQVIPYSHGFGVTIQELMGRAGTRRGELTLEQVLAWAAERDRRVELVRFDMGDGDAVFFDGRLWHGTDNTNTEGVRVALLLQYATPDRPIRIPDYTHLEWPFRFQDRPRPPCIMVWGTDTHGVNRVVPPPSQGSGGSSWVKQLDLPLAENRDTGWQVHRIFRGATRCLPLLTCHASVLGPGRTPHDLHAHAEEEILVVLSGEATLMIEEDGATRTEKARPGTFCYYPAGQRHTLRNDSPAAITYLMFKWRASDLQDREGSLGTFLHRPGQLVAGDDGNRPRAWNVERVVEGPTGYLRKLRAHVSTLLPGGGYDPHVDAYDVALLVLRGTVETLDRRVGPNGVVFYSAGEPHGIRNVGEEPATYLVCEFHGAHSNGEVPLDRKRPRRGVRSRLARSLPPRVREAVKTVLNVPLLSRLTGRS